MIFIAEIGMNHNGNLDLCYELIKQARHSGADIAKFQLGWRDKPEEINHITPETLGKLRQWCDYFDIEFMASIITPGAYEMVKKVSPKRYKIASRTVRDEPELVRRIIDEGREVIVSLGMWDKEGLPSGAPNVKYLWCRSKYPAEPRDLVGMPSDFGNSPYWGYSDHSIGIETCLLAVSRGARCVEKHFTLDKSSVVIRDHALSATPDEFRNMVNIGRDIAAKLEIGV